MSHPIWATAKYEVVTLYRDHHVQGGFMSDADGIDSLERDILADDDICCGEVANLTTRERHSFYVEDGEVFWEDLSPLP